MSAFFKIIISLVAVVVMGFGFWIVMYQPKQKQIMALDKDILDEKRKYEEYKLEAQNLAQWEQTRTEFQKVLSNLHQTSPVKDFIPSFLTDIEKMVKEERANTNDPSFQVTSITPGTVTQESAAPRGAASSAPSAAPAAGATPTEKQDEKKTAQVPPAAPPQVQAGRSTIQLNFTGRFDTIVDFLQQLGNFKLNKLVTIQRISLSPQASSPGLSPTLTVTMPFEVYMLGGGG